MQGHTEELKRGFSSGLPPKQPIFVDRATNIVLDGMHRVRTLGELGCCFALICLVRLFRSEDNTGALVQTYTEAIHRLDAERVVISLGASLRPAKGVNPTQSSNLLLSLWGRYLPSRIPWKRRNVSLPPLT